MFSLLDILFGPLDKIYCIYFYILSIIGILFGIFLCILCILYPILLKNSMIISYFILSFIMYFQNRLLFQMCIDKLYKETYTSLSDNETSMGKIENMKKESDAINNINRIIGNTTYGNAYIPIRDSIKDDIDKNAAQIYNSSNILFSNDEVPVLKISDFTQDIIDLSYNPKIWTNFANAVEKAQKTQISTIQSQPVISENKFRALKTCGQPMSCPVVDDVPFCTSTGWACPHMWTPRVQNYNYTTNASNSQINASDLIYF